MRPSKDDWCLQLAQVVALRSTCLRRAVGCVLVDSRGHILSTGYNGVAAGLPHCNEMVVNRRNVSNDELVGYVETYDYPHACAGAHAPSGTNLDGCEAVHAEQNALLQCPDIYQIRTCYVTASPCVTCTKLLMNTSCERIVFIESYPQPAARDLWLKSRESWTWVQRAAK